MSDIGTRFAQALAAKQADAMSDLLAPELDFKALTPGRFWEGATPEEAVTVFFGSWFDPDDRIDELVSIETGRVGDRESVTYRLQVTNADGKHDVEQRAYYDVQDGRIGYLRVLCSGYMPRR